MFALSRSILCLLKNTLFSTSKKYEYSTYITYGLNSFFVLIWLLSLNLGHAGTYNDASFNGSWSWNGVAQTSSPTRVAGNLSFSKLTTSGYALSVSNAYADFRNFGNGAVTNTISGGITLSGTGWADFNNIGSGAVTNTISGGITLSGTGWADFYNTGSGTVSNTITGVITLSGSGGASFYNRGSGTVTNTIDTVTLSAGTLYLGGGGSTTKIGTLNWNGGNLKLMYANEGFGSTRIANLNVTAPVTLTLVNSGGTSLTTSSGSYTLLTVDTFTGNPSNITLVNTSPFVEVVNANGSSNGISINGNTVTINLAPTASANNPNDMDHYTSSIDIHSTIVSNEISKQFAPTPYQKAEAGARIQKALQQRKGGDSFENLLTALSEEGDSNKFVKITGDYRVFAAPYTTYTRNNGNALNGSSSKYYGMVMGLTHLVKSIDTNFFFTAVVGASKTQMNRSVNSYITSKNTTLGISARKTFIKHLDVDSGLNLTAVRNEQWRQGNPTPNTSYIAKSKFNTYAAAWRNETGYIFKLPNKQSLKPNIGLQLNGTKQTAINERDAGIYAQSYKSKTGMNGELYGGLGYRKEWKNERFEGKLTGKYEIGRKSGNGKVRTTVYTASTPDGLSTTSTGPDLITHYVSVYGSILDMKTNWKIVPGVTASFQKHQKSGTFVIKLERRF
jgi:hypothetical protein